MIWQNLLDNPGRDVDLGNLRHNAGFQRFVEGLPELLANIAHQTLDVSVLMHAQYRITRAFAEILQAGEVQDSILQHANGLSQYQHADVFLDALGIGIDGHCHLCGMSAEEISAMKEGKYEVGTFLVRRPAVFLSPVLPKRQVRN